MSDFESLVLDALANEVVNDVDVFSSLVVSVVFGKVDSTSIVDKDGGRRGFDFVKSEFNQK